MLDAGSNIVIKADDGNGHSGTSNPFDVIMDPNTIDSDRDGMPDVDEAIAGTNPHDSNSCFRVTQTGISGGFVVHWNAVTSSIYSVFWTDNLLITNGFQSLQTGIPYPHNSYTDTLHNAQDTGYYRIDVQLDE